MCGTFFPIYSGWGCPSWSGFGIFDTRTANAGSWYNSTNIYSSMSSGDIWGSTWNKMQLNFGNSLNNFLFGNSNMFNGC